MGGGGGGGVFVYIISIAVYDGGRFVIAPLCVLNIASTWQNGVCATGGGESTGQAAPEDCPISGHTRGSGQHMSG